ncbi:MAG: fatty acid desaturase [Flavobacteriales bacterium]|nr:fatty acid desaturase [Flavobacteriales bacterium]
METKGIFRYRADVLTLLTVLGCAALMAASWWAIPQLTWPWVVAVVAVNCCYQFCVATIVHNTVHVPLFHSLLLNRMFQMLLSGVHGHPVSGFVPGHNLSHHKHLQTPMDSARTTRARFRWNILNQAFFFFLLMFEIMAAEQRFVKKMRKVKPRWARQYAMEAFVVFGLKIALLIIDWKLAVLILIIPNFYATWGIFGTNYWQHDGCDHTHPYNHSRNFTGRLFNILTFNNGYHAIHHMRPEVHWSLYPEYHAREVKPHCHPNLDQPSLIAYLWRTHVWPGKRSDYLGNPIAMPPAEDFSQDWVADVPDSPDTAIALGAIQ